MRRFALAMLVLLLARADMYPDASNAKLPEAQQNLGIQVVGAKCDGVADDAAAINAAMLAASTAPDGKLSAVTLPKGVCMLSAPVTLLSNVTLQGQGMGQTRLKLKPNTCTDVMLGPADAYALFGTEAPGIGNFGIKNMTIDGNRANQVGCVDAGKVNGITFYGYKPILHSLSIEQVLGHGIRSEWQTWGYVPGGMGVNASMLSIENTGRHGWWNNGPHDSSVDHLRIVNSSLEVDDTYSGLIEGPKGGGRYFNYHYATTTGSVPTRPKFAYIDSGGNSEFIASHFEGARKLVELNGGATRIIASRFYFPAGINNALIDIRSNGNMLTNNYYVGIEGQANWAIDFGPGGEAPRQNVITGYFSNFGTSGLFKFTSDGGNNQINAHGYSASGVGPLVTGTPATTSTVCYEQVGLPAPRVCTIQGTHLRLENNVLSEYLTNATAGIAVNYNGYIGGTTQFRDLNVYNGKQVKILSFEGATKHLLVGGGVPAVTACGTAPAITGSDLAGTVTLGTGSPTGCTISFAAAYANPPLCTVTWQQNLPSMQYVLAAASITLTQTATSSNKVNYTCFGSAGG